MEPLRYHHLSLFFSPAAPGRDYGAERVTYRKRKFFLFPELIILSLISRKAPVSLAMTGGASRPSRHGLLFLGDSRPGKGSGD